MSSQTVIAKTDAFRAKTVNPETADLKIVDYKVADSKIEGEKITERITAIPIAEVAEVKEEEEKLKTLLPFVRFSPQTARAAQAFATTRREMFSQSFVELSGVDRRRRRWTQMSSLLVQSLIVAFLVILPLWFIDILPAQQLATFLIAPPPPPPPPPPAAPTLKPSKVVSEVINAELVAPNKIPKKVKNITEEEAPAPMAGVIGGVEGGVPGGSAGGVIGSLLSATPHTANIPIAVPKRLRVSTGVSEGLLYHRVEPVYPSIAQRARIEGSVELKAIISKEGTIEGLQRITGHPMLMAAAMDAVKQWRYRPYMLNGEPLEVETDVVVNFHIH
jgi:periplasmic protein TonB